MVNRENLQVGSLSGYWKSTHNQIRCEVKLSLGKGATLSVQQERKACSWQGKHRTVVSAHRSWDLTMLLRLSLGTILGMSWRGSLLK